MYIIVGLGNFGKEYVNTRHNVGFDVIDKLAEQENIAVLEKKHKAVIGKGTVAGQKCILAKPLTYMNLSGECVAPVMNYYKESPENVIVLFDDISLDVGKIRIRKKGSAGGHNGIKSIIGGLNWGLIGLFQFDLVAFLLGGSGSLLSRIVYVLVAIAAIWCISLLFRDSDDARTERA